MLPSFIVLAHNALSLCRHMYEYVPGSAIVVIKLLRCHVRLFVSPLRRNQRCLFSLQFQFLPHTPLSSTVSVFFLFFSRILFTNLITLNLNQFRIFFGYLSNFFELEYDHNPRRLTTFGVAWLARKTKKKCSYSQLCYRSFAYRQHIRMGTKYCGLNSIMQSI